MEETMTEVSRFASALLASAKSPSLAHNLNGDPVFYGNRRFYNYGHFNSPEHCAVRLPAAYVSSSFRVTSR